MFVSAPDGSVYVIILCKSLASRVGLCLLWFPNNYSKFWLIFDISVLFSSFDFWSLNEGHNLDAECDGGYRFCQELFYPSKSNMYKQR